MRRVKLNTHAFLQSPNRRRCTVGRRVRRADRPLGPPAQVETAQCRTLDSLFLIQLNGIEVGSAVDPMLGLAATRFPSSSQRMPG